MIDDQSINFDASNGDTLEQKGLGTCPGCIGKPCGDHGTCVPGVGDKFTCRCDETYSGKLCDTPKGKILLRIRFVKLSRINRMTSVNFVLSGVNTQLVINSCKISAVSRFNNSSFSPGRNVYFAEDSSMMILSVNKEYVDFDISFNIRPQVKTAPLVITFFKKDYISIAMRHGIIEAR